MKKFFIGLVAFIFLFSLYAPTISQATSFESLGNEGKINPEKEIPNSEGLNDLTKLNTFGTNSINIITHTDEKVIYEIEKDGEKLHYEEDIKQNKDNTEINTKVYLVEDNGLLKLIDNFTTEIIDNQGSIEIIQSGEKTPVVIPEFDSSESPEISTLAYDPWVVSSHPGLNFGYRKDYKTGKAQAKYSTMLRSNLSISNKNFETFAKEIDSLKSIELNLVKDATFISLIEAGLKLKDKITLAGLLEIGRKFVAPIDVVRNAFNWIVTYNSASARFSTLGGTKTTICNHSC